MKRAHHLVMIHGLLGSLDYFSPAERLPSLAVHTPDLIGYGPAQSPASIRDLSLEDQAESVTAYIVEHVQAPCWLLGHSVGGAVAMLLAQRQPELVAGVINVEGNFTLNDAFWCKKIANLPTDVWTNEYKDMVTAPSRWLRRSDIAVTPQRVAWAEQILHNQPPSTVQAMAQAVVKDTGRSEYLQVVRKVVDCGVPMYLLAGERSKAGWDVPEWVLATAKGYVVQPKTGHMMMLEEPTEFCRLVGQIMRDSHQG